MVIALALVLSNIQAQQKKDTLQIVSLKTILGNKPPRDKQDGINDILKNNWISLHDTSESGISFIADNPITRYVEDNGHNIIRVWFKIENSKTSYTDEMLKNATTLMLIDVDCYYNRFAICQVWVLGKNNKLIEMPEGRKKGFQDAEPYTFGSFLFNSACKFFVSK